ncbi:cation:proton antiporter [Qipengyuania sp. 1NDW9]|uniref:Cation:proton antiporter n=1 Tax=Qipengyuania xiapuensis TaxID=2867236 RepID=A0ABX8ZRZ7_9SPHN|nr:MULTISPECIES: sodium:proton antiporter [Qipengyuania]MBX7491590.1 cation:proton antiporter [Qipengyuania xiapuensis]MBY6127245.1 cation:proton antiporter [Qipengyuania aquimaris]QZD91674.1 cation:proton antiporter [Qipengyuania xiapuensis]UOR16255.1 cation:proton antiporter [Qipengyuania aquimaris]
MEQTLVIALVGILGIGAQWIAWRTGWPAIVLMLAAGFLAGPVLGIFDPEHAFGELLEPMVAVGVALILFEGGLSLDFRELRHSGSAVMRLATIGVVLGWLFGSLAGIYIAGLAPEVAILFGGILVVTGPTVVIPLLRQSSIKSRPASILKWEAIVNDPTGALCAVIAYEYFRKVAETPDATLFQVVPPLIIAAILAGLIGYVAALAIAWSFPRGAVPEYLKVPVLLAAVIGVFVISNLIEHEAGLVAVTVMGVALANMNVSSLRSIHPFKENIAILLVSGIFILLSASLDWEELSYLNPMTPAGLNMMLFLLALLFLVRPATILLSLLGSSVPWNERLLLAWIAPRGIVLVAISGLFALRLSDLGYSDGNLLIGLSFAVVVVTIVAHGFTIDFVAKLLKVKGVTRPGMLIVGSTPWTIALAEQMRELKAPVIVVDASWQRLGLARQKGIDFYHGEILNEATEHNLELAPYQNLVAATENEAYNALVCNEFAHEIGRDRVFQLGESADGEDRHALPESLRGRALFESGFGVEDVSERQRQGWVFRKTKLSDEFDFEKMQERLPNAANMLLLVRSNGTIRFFTHAAKPEPRAGDTILSFSPPQTKTAEEMAAKKASKKQGPQPT